MSFGASLIVFIFLAFAVFVVFAATKDDPRAENWRGASVAILVVAFVGLFVSASFAVFIILLFGVFVIFVATRNKPAAGKWRAGAVATLVVAFVVLFVTLPQMRAGERAQKEAGQQAKERAEYAIRIEQERTESKAKEAAIASASESEIRALVVECQDEIREELRKGRPSFEPYFARYDIKALNTLGSVSRTTGGAIARLSTMLDDYDFDPVEHNVEQIMREKLPSRSIVFVVEHAMDSFSGIRRYVTTYRCYLDGLGSPSSPSRGEVYFMD